MNEIQVPREILSDFLSLIWEGQIFDQLKPATQQWVIENNLESLIRIDQTKRLEPRLKLEEYERHILSAMKIPPTQREFYLTIIRVTYMMLLVEKNPLVAQELRGASVVSGLLDQLFRR